MAVKVGDAEIDVRADVSNFDNDLKKGVGGALDSVDADGREKGKKFGQGYGGAIAAAAGSTILIGGAKLLGDALKDATEAAQIGAIVGNAIKTGGTEARGLTKGVFDGIAQDLGKALVIDDDDIAKGLAPLLRIPDIGKEQFEKLAKVAADASAGTGKDLEAVSLALSKIATDPEAAIGALRGLGIQVEQTTKETVKGLVEQGKSGEALNIILDEVNQRYAGAAKAAGDAAGPSQRFGLAIDQLKESIGTALLPVIDKLAKIIVPVAQAFTNLPGPVQTILVAFAGLALAAVVLAPIFGAIATALGFIGPIIGTVGLAFATFTGIAIGPLILIGVAVVALGVIIFKFRDEIFGALKAVGSFFADLLGPVLDFAKEWGILLLGPIGFIFKFRDEIADALRAVGSFFLDLLGSIVDFAKEWGILLLGPIGFIIKFRDEIGDAIASVIDFFSGIPGAVGDFLSAATDRIGDFLGAVGEFFGSIPGIVGDALSSAIDGISTFIGNAGEFFGSLPGIVGDALGSAVRSVSDGVGSMLDIIGSVPGRILDTLGDLGGLLYDAGLAIMRGLRDGIVDGFNAVKNFVSGIAGKIADLKGPLDFDRRLLTPAGDAIMGGLLGGIKGKIPALVGLLGDVTRMIDVGVGNVSAGGTFRADIRSNRSAPFGPGASQTSPVQSTANGPQGTTTINVVSPYDPAAVARAVAAELAWAR